MKKRYYFAYGSNCNLGQMAHRCPDATLVGRVTLQNYRLTFNGRGMMRSSGVASVRRHNGRYVPGLLWEITPECERSLDRYEGYPYLYEKKNVTVHTEDGGTVKAMVYVMTDRYQDPAIPSSGYLQGIVEGFQENGLNVVPVLDALAETKKQIMEAGGKERWERWADQRN